MSFREWLKKFAIQTLLIGALAAILGLAAAAGAWWRIKLAVKGETVIVPDLVGQTIDEALQTLADLELELALDQGQRVHSNVIEKDRVYLQIPRPGRKIKTKRIVEVTISAGPEKKVTPKLEGETLTFAETLLASINFEPQILSRAYSDLEERGRVLSQHPAAGEPLGLRAGASLLISEGPQPEWFVMPDLIGRDYSSVKAFLDKNRFRVVAKYQTGDQGLGQVVLQQTPRAGYPVSRAQTLTLVVNKDF